MGRAGLRLVTGVVLLFIYFPLALVILYAVNRNIVASWPIPGLTLQWWARAIANPGVRDALLTSVVAGLGATAPCWQEPSSPSRSASTRSSSPPSPAAT